MTTLTISIGLDTPTGPLPIRQQIVFTAMVDRLLTDIHAIVHFSGRGVGIYEGREEPSYTWVFATDPRHYPPIRARLAELAHAFGQDSIALTIGQTEFIKP